MIEARNPYPIGSPGAPWGAEEKLRWRASVQKTRDYSEDVVQRVERLASRFHVVRYGTLQYGADGDFALLALETSPWDDALPLAMVTGGVQPTRHAYAVQRSAGRRRARGSRVCARTRSGLDSENEALTRTQGVWRPHFRSAKLPGCCRAQSLRRAAGISRRSWLRHRVKGRRRWSSRLGRRPSTGCSTGRRLGPCCWEPRP